MEFLEKYKASFDQFVQEHRFAKDPKNLYEPIDYILDLGGKRIRPLLLLMAADYCKGSYESALNAAMAVEVFHNFTLLHDDIMDEAPLRRGKPTVHKVYNDNIAILSGDVMMIYAYDYLLKYPAQLSQQLLKVFNQMAILVCEGQQDDMDFETRENVTIPEYIQMIENKTSVLIGAAMQMGAIVAEKDESTGRHFYEFGKNVGIAFQIQDDVLDTYGDPGIGKQQGGDIIQNKKTYLYLKALELADANEKGRLESLYSQKDNSDTAAKIDAVKAIFDNNNVRGYAEELKLVYKDLALSHLRATEVDEQAMQVFEQFADYLLSRTH